MSLNRRQFLSRGAAMGFALKWGCAFAAADSSQATRPTASGAGVPHSAKPWVYWYWMNGLVTREGIAADLQAMHDAGLGGAYLMTIGKDSPLMAAPVTPASSAFWAMLEWASSEAARLGLDIAMSVCDGWATAGGPWIDPVHAMQKVVWSRVTVEGGAMLQINLPEPPLCLGSFQDAGNRPLPKDHRLYRELAVLALPAGVEPERSSATESVKVRSTLSGVDQQQAQDLFLFKPGHRGIRASTTGYLEIEFHEPLVCRSVSLRAQEFPYQASRMELLFSEDGETFHSLGRLTLPEHGWDDRPDIPATHSIPPTRARIFRLVYDPAGSERAVANYQERYDKSSLELKLSGVLLSSAPVIHQFEGKAGYVWRSAAWTTSQQVPAELCIPLRSMVDLSGSVDADGRLRWHAPPGRWTILRIGYAPTGAVNATGGGAAGLECDKFDPSAMETQLSGWLGKAIEHVKPRLGSTSSFVAHIDSWEAGCQNWSRVFASQFRQRRGYDPLPYLPAMAGIPVESAEVSERFLWDVRQTISELVADSLYAATQSFSHRHSASFSAEAIAPVMPADGMMHQRYVDIPMGEFWWNSTHNDKPTDCLEAISAAHLHGKPVVQMESFTTVKTTWDEHPFRLKALGDHNLCLGANRFVLHVFTLQAWPERAPGITLSGVGQFLTGHQVWWKPGRAWMEYLGRCQALLQQGSFVVDLLYFIGDDSPRRALLPEQILPSVPNGYHYDSIDPETLLSGLMVQNGRLRLPDGNSYVLLVLPPSERMTPATLGKIKQLVADGATVVGAAPTLSPSLSGGAESSSAAVRAAAAELWGECDGVRVREHRFGKGRIVYGRPLSELLAEVGEPADFLYTGAEGIEFTHRHSPAEDMYFISNQKLEAQRPTCSFRVGDTVPEILLPATGETLHCATVRRDGGRTLLELELDPYESVFVRFRKTAHVPEFVHTLRRDGHTIPAIANATLLRTGCLLGPGGELLLRTNEAGNYTVKLASGRHSRHQVAMLPSPLPLTGVWELRFQEKRGAPERLELRELIDWTRHADPGVRHFSGTAVYRTHFDLPPEYLFAGREVYLDLGEVHMLAEIRLNGRALGVLWKPPFVMEVTAALQQSNELEIEISNVWKNRLIGDAGLPVAERISWFADDAVRRHPELQPGAPLVASGLLGPVSLRPLTVVSLNQE